MTSPKGGYALHSFDIPQMFSVLENAASKREPTKVEYPTPAKARRMMFLLHSFRKQYRLSQRLGFELIEKVRLHCEGNILVFTPATIEFASLFEKLSTVDAPQMTNEEIEEKLKKKEKERDDLPLTIDEIFGTETLKKKVQ